MANNEIPVKSYLNLERDPISTYHAATKGYVDTAVQGVAESKAAASHTHAAGDITSGTIGAARLPAATPSTLGAVSVDTTKGLTIVESGSQTPSTPIGQLSISVATLAPLIGTNLGLGTAATKDSAATVTSGGGGLPTEGAVVTYVTGYAAAKSHQHTLSQISDAGTAASCNTGTSAGNVPVLGTGGKLPQSVIPAIAITDTFTAATESAMLALSGANKGDICVRTDLNKTFVLTSDATNAYKTLSNWQEMLTPTDTVTSVNGAAGAVTQADLGLETTLTTTSDTAFPSSKAVYTYVSTNYAEKTHSHAASEITSGTLAAARLPDATASAKGAVILAKAASSGTTDTTNDAKAITPKAAKQIADDAVSGAASGYAAAGHNHDASEINSGTLYAARLPAATTSAKGAVKIGTGLKISSETITPDFLAASSGSYDTTNTTKPITAAAAKAIADASAAAATPKAKIFTISGNGSTTEFTCTHGLGTANVLAQVFDSNGQLCWVATKNTGTAVVFDFAAAPASGTTYTAVIFGVTSVS